MGFTKGQSGIYNSTCCTVFNVPGKRLFENIPGYLIKENKSGTIHDNIPESEIMTCDNDFICNSNWDDFTYTGDNKAASEWIIKNIIRYLNGSNALEWGNNEGNTEYFFKMNNSTWVKQNQTIQ